jgi:hypothetical protein
MLDRRSIAIRNRAVRPHEDKNHYFARSRLDRIHWGARKIDGSCQPTLRGPQRRPSAKRQKYCEEQCSDSDGMSAAAHARPHPSGSGNVTACPDACLFPPTSGSGKRSVRRIRLLSSGPARTAGRSLGTSRRRHHIGKAKQKGCGKERARQILSDENAALESCRIAGTDSFSRRTRVASAITLDPLSLTR